VDPSIVNTAVEVAKECYCVLPLLNGSGGNRRESVITNEDYEMVLIDNKNKTQDLGLFYSVTSVLSIPMLPLKSDVCRKRYFASVT
jgi:hypothetical protein